MQQRLGHRIPPVGVALDQKFADLIGPRRPPGFAGRQHVVAVGGQDLGERCYLRRLAGPLAAFEGDEFAARRGSAAHFIRRP